MPYGYEESQSMKVGSGYGSGSAPTPYQGEAQEKPLSPLAQRLGELQKTISWLDQGIDNLTGKVSPVLRPETPQANAKQAREPVGQSSLSTTLAEAVYRIENLARRVESLAERVEL